MNPRWRTILLLAVVAFSSDALAAPRPAPTVSGRVTTDDGTPAPHAYVSFDRHLGDRKDVMARQDGTFAVRLDDGTPNRITVHEGDAEVPLQIRVREETPP